MKKITMLVMVMMLMTFGDVGAKELKAKTNIPIDKTFIIEMSGKVNPNTVKGNITVTTQDKKQMKIDVEASGNRIFVTPTGFYKPGTTYHLTVKDKIRDTKNRKMKEYNSFKFTTAGITDAEWAKTATKPKNIPLGATLTKMNQYETRYDYNKIVSGGYKVTWVAETNADGSFAMEVKHKDVLITFVNYSPGKDEISFPMKKVVPVSPEVVNDLYEIGREFSTASKANKLDAKPATKPVTKPEVKP